MSRVATVNGMRERTITIRLDDGSTTQVDGWAAGDWTAHRAWARTGWVVTHTPTGVVVPSRALDESEAKGLAKWLDGTMPLLQREDLTDGYILPEKASNILQRSLSHLGMNK